MRVGFCKLMDPELRPFHLGRNMGKGMVFSKTLRYEKRGERKGNYADHGDKSFVKGP